VEKSVILVAEDEALIRLSAVLMLEDAGYLVLEAGTAEEALEVLESRNDIAAVFTDIEMPPGTLCGLRLAKAVKDRWPAIQVIVTSGRKAVDELDFPKLGRFIRKPYQPEQVLTALAELLGRPAYSFKPSHMQQP